MMIKYIGYVSLKEIAKEMIINSSSDIETSFDNLVKTLSATKYYQFDSLIKGKTTIINVSYYMFVDNDIVIDSESVVIGCTRPHVLEYVIKNNAKLVILSDNYPLSKEIELIKEKKVNVIVSPYDTLKISRIICLANPINNIQRAVSSVCFEPIDYLSDFLEVSNKLKHTNYPIVNSRGYCEGMLRLIDTNDIVRKDVILVDHNEPSQSVDGLNEANIIEIVDHHNIGTIIPINRLIFVIC